MYYTINRTISHTINRTIHNIMMSHDNPTMRKPTMRKRWLIFTGYISWIATQSLEYFILFLKTRCINRTINRTINLTINHTINRTISCTIHNIMTSHDKSNDEKTSEEKTMVGFYLVY